MAGMSAARRPWHLWAVGVLSLLWNSGGGIDFVMTKTHNARYLAAFTPEQLAWFDGFSWWANLAWAAGVWGALLGSVLLLVASRRAVEAFAVSLAGFVIGVIHQFGSGRMPAAFATTGNQLFTAVLGVVAVLLLWYALRMRVRGVLH